MVTALTEGGTSTPKAVYVVLGVEGNQKVIASSARLLGGAKRQGSSLATSLSMFPALRLHIATCSHFAVGEVHALSSALEDDCL